MEKIDKTEMPESLPPDFYSELKRNSLRRALWHDYCSRCIYLITLTKNSAVPVFSQVIKKGDSIVTDFTWTGWAVYNAIQKFKKQFPAIITNVFVIMPDHVHAIVYVSERLDEHLGQYIRLLKKFCTQSYHSKAMIRMPSEEPVFEQGFNDRILTRENQLSIWNNYVYDNPRRLWIMRNYNDFFQKSERLLTELVPEEALTRELKEGGKIQLYGNHFLVDYPERIAVKINRHDTAEQWEEKRREALRVAKNRGVLISPFVHPSEKAVMAEGLQLGARIIKIVPDGFLPRQKPHGHDFYHCAEGRMLFLGYNTGSPSPTPYIYDLCSRMNKFADSLTKHGSACFLRR